VTRLRRAIDVGVVSVVVLVAVTSRARGASSCDCARFTDELASARAAYASRGEGATMELVPAVRERFRDRVLDAYARAQCLVDCPSVAERDRDEARVLLAETAWKSESLGPNPDTARARVDRALAETARCLSHEPALPACHLWHGSIVGERAEASWSPMQIALPRQLLAEFRAARAGTSPGTDPPDGGATRAEATLLMRAPRITGGDTDAAVRLMEEASRAPGFTCRVDNRVVYAEALARSGAPLRALGELRSALADGLPSCGESRYENASDLGDVAHCAARLEAHPDRDPGWSDDCE
jgi:hypothetical protein